MKFRIIAPALLLIAACATRQPSVAPRNVTTVLPPPPVTEQRPVTETLHDVTVTDPYRWLEDQQSSETRAWIDRQNSYTDAVLGNRPERASFATRLEQLLNTDQIGIPIYHSGRYFFTRRAQGKDVFSIYLRNGVNGTDELLIDPAPWNPKHTTNVGIEDVSNDGRLLAYYVREGGADEVEIRFFDIDSRKDVGTPLKRARYQGVSFTPDKSQVYFTNFIEDGTSRVFRRALAGGVGQELFGAGYTSDKIIGSTLSDDGKYLLITVYHGAGGKKTEHYIKNLSTDGPIQTIVNDLEARHTVDIAGDTLVIETNWNASNDRVMTASAADPGRANWKEIVPENSNAAIQGISAAGGEVFVRYLENVKPRLVSFDLAGRHTGEVAFETVGRLGDVAGTWHTPVAFYRFDSFALPPTIYQVDVVNGTRSVFAQQQVPVDPNTFTVEQVTYPSTDGTRVPMFLFYKKGLQRNGKNPTILTGYGGFNAAQLPAFSTSAVAWAEQGGVWALANLRGGSEFGEAWHRAGMLEKKQNVFEDFASAARYLTTSGYTSSEHLGISGTSNGGLLVTALATQHPALVKAVHVGYPLVDMLRFHKFLVGAFWIAEYGSADDPEQFRYLYAYSPYQHVVKGTKYPAFLFVTGDADTRVAPLHARKAAALFQASTGSTNPVLIRYHVSGGHSGGEPLGIQVTNSSEILSFFAWQLR